MVGSNLDLDAARKAFVRMTETFVRDLGEDRALELMRACREELERAIGECNFVIGSRSIFSQRCEAEKVSRETLKFTVIEGGL